MHRSLCVTTIYLQTWSNFNLHYIIIVAFSEKYQNSILHMEKDSNSRIARTSNMNVSVNSDGPQINVVVVVVDITNINLRLETLSFALRSFLTLRLHARPRLRCLCNCRFAGASYHHSKVGILKQVTVYFSISLFLIQASVENDDSDVSRAVSRITSLTIDCLQCRCIHEI